MGKRKTAKTGDKALYGAREKLANQSRSTRKGDDDPMYDEVDRFHNDRDNDFIQLVEKERQEFNDDDEDLTGNIHSVLDLGAGGESSDEENDDDDDSSSEEEPAYDDKQARNHSSSEDSDSSDDDDDDIGNDEMIQEDPRNWGKKKSLYYHGDTADLEIGQEEDDAYLEEEAAQEIQKSRFEEMDEDDFVLSGDEKESSSKKKDTQVGDVSKAMHENLQTVRDVSQLSKKEIRKLLSKKFPELLPMASYFHGIVKDLNERTEIATKLLMESNETAESVGATIKGRQYLVTKSMIQKSIALNSVLYLLLRCASAADEDVTSTIQAHPVMDHLQKLTTLIENLEEALGTKAKDIDSQLDNLVKAGKLMTTMGEGDDDDDARSSDGDEKSVSSTEVNSKLIENGNDANDSDEMSDNSDENTGKIDTEILAQKKQREYERTLNESRFGLRPNEVKKASNTPRKYRSHDLDDFGDLDEDQGNLSGNALASTINTIEQRSKTASRKRRPAPIAEELDEYDEYDSRVAEGLKMMEEEMGKLDDDNDDGDKGVMEMHDDDMADPDADNDDSMGFYNHVAEKNKRKKSVRKSLYKVAPKYPRVDGEVTGERSISRTILKNRGLVAHKAKINRNPRVKKREQYRKALIRRKGAVRGVRDASEGSKYGGEQTGIKSGISRSRKL